MASNNIEIEAKVLLSQNDYVKIVNALHLSGKVVSQTNYYLDSADRILKHYGMILRIREVKNQFTLTLKAPMAEGLLEKNQVLGDAEAQRLIHENVFPEGDIHDFLGILHLPIKELKILAQLTTEREECSYKDTIIDVSKNTYSGKTDYELECDSDSAHKSQDTLRTLCEEVGVPFVLNNLSKETRAINAATGSK